MGENPRPWRSTKCGDTGCMTCTVSHSLTLGGGPRSGEVLPSPKVTSSAPLPGFFHEPVWSETGPSGRSQDASPRSGTAHLCCTKSTKLTLVKLAPSTGERSRVAPRLPTPSADRIASHVAQTKEVEREGGLVLPTIHRSFGPCMMPQDVRTCYECLRTVWDKAPRRVATLDARKHSREGSGGLRAEAVH